MEERLRTVRVHTHPESWVRSYFHSSRVSAPNSVFGEPRLAASFLSKVVCASRLPIPTEVVASIPRTCTVPVDCAYSISSEVIQCVIPEATSKAVSTFDVA
jgi:hypothetical protein